MRKRPFGWKDCPSDAVCGRGNILLIQVVDHGNRQRLVWVFVFGELAQQGAIDWLVEPELVNDRSEALISTLIGLAPLSVRAMLSIIKSVETGSFDRNQSQELADQCSASQDLEEGLRALRERRPPMFKGC